MKIQAALLDLEQRVSRITGSTVSGTILSRVLVSPGQDAHLSAHIRQDCPTLPATGPVWCLALGPLMMRKRFWYGVTVIDAIRNAQRDMTIIEYSFKRAAPNLW